MYTGSLPAASIYGTWSETLELRDAEDGGLADFTDITEITLSLCNPSSGYQELTLTYTGGDITMPDDGLIQWRAEVDVMGALSPGLYNVRLVVEDGEDTIVLILGTIPIVGDVGARY